MILLQNAFTIFLVLSGTFFLLSGSIGVVRLPHFFSRAHAVGKADSLGIILVLLGFAVHEGISLNALKLLTIILFIALINPSASHALARAAWRYGDRPWFRGEPARDVNQISPDEIKPHSKEGSHHAS